MPDPMTPQERAAEIARDLSGRQRLLVAASAAAAPYKHGTYRPEVRDDMVAMERAGLGRTFVVGDGADGWMGMWLTDEGHAVAALLTSQP